MGVQVMMTYDHGAGVTLVQVFEQLAHGYFLFLGTRVGCLAVFIKSAFIADTYRIGIVVHAVRTDHPFRPTLFYTSVTTDHVMVAYTELPFLLFAMIPVNLGDRAGLVGLYCRTVDDDHGYAAHA